MNARPVLDLSTLNPPQREAVTTHRGAAPRPRRRRARARPASSSTASPTSSSAASTPSRSSPSPSPTRRRARCASASRSVAGARRGRTSSSPPSTASACGSCSEEHAARRAAEALRHLRRRRPDRAREALHARGEGGRPRLRRAPRPLPDLAREERGEEADLPETGGAGGRLRPRRGEVFPRYQRALAAQRAVDFDDLIARPVELLSKDEALRKKYARRFRHLLVDEYQDTNVAQLELAEAPRRRATGTSARWATTTRPSTAGAAPR